MIKKKYSVTKHSVTQKKDSRSSFLLLSLSFALGCMVGSLIGSFFDFDNALSDFIVYSDIESLGYFKVFFSYIRFHLVVILLSSSFFGIVLLPCLSGIRGYALSCTAATIISAYPQNGIIMALVTLGIPAIFSLPCFFVMSVEAFQSSRRIFNLTRGSYVIRTDKFYVRAIACLPFLVIGTILEMKLVPYLISLLT